MYQLAKFSRLLAKPPTIIPTQSETTAWVSAVTGGGGSVSAGRQTTVNALIYALKNAGVWTKLDVLWLFAAENAISALTDLKGLLDATASGSPTFTTDRGYTGSGTANVTIPYDPSAGTNFTQNSACVFGWSNTSSSQAGAMIRNTPDTISIYPNQSGNAFFNVNDGNYPSIAVSDGLGFYHANRTASNAKQFYKNGSSITTASNTSGSPHNSSPNFNGNLDWPGQCSAMGAGGSLDSTEALAFYNAMRTYMTAVGVP